MEQIPLQVVCYVQLPFYFLFSSPKTSELLPKAAVHGVQYKL